jgi:transposase
VPPDPAKRRILILDNASWHKSARLHWHHFEARFLPAYSPDLNPIERFWLRLKADYFTDFIAHTPQELEDHACAALRSYMSDPATVDSQCSTRK